MLSFTHDSQRKTYNPYQLEVQQEYHPIVIKNTQPNRQQYIQPIRSKKKLVKTHSNNMKRKSIQRTQRPKNKIAQFQNKLWNTQTVTNNNVGLFDKNLKRDTLAAEERQIRAQSRIKEVSKKTDTRDDGRKNKLLTKQQEIHRKKMEILTQEQEKQIQKLKQLIEKERLQKQKNDQEYEQKKKQIQAERKQLIQLEKQIQRQGPKATKEIQQKMRSIDPQVPANDKVKLKDPLNQTDPRKNKGYETFNEITQSESIANQKNKIRQQQLEYLVDQREKNFKQYQRNTLGYTPAIIPLLSRASYKIISTQISSLVQLLVDDLLEEQVYLLEAIELQEKAESFERKQKQAINDYVKKLQDFVDETDQIEDKLGRYNQMRFQDIYKFPPLKEKKYGQSQFTYTKDMFHKLELGLTADQLEQIEHRIGRFKRYVNSFDEYKPGNIQMFKQVTEQIINQAIQKLVKELDNGAGEFVNIVFRNEFE